MAPSNLGPPPGYIEHSDLDDHLDNLSGLSLDDDKDEVTMATVKQT